MDFSDPYSPFDVVMVVKGAVKQQQPPKTLADIETATFGIVTGTSLDLLAQKEFPNAERKYFSNSSDLLLALEQGKIDVFLADKTVYAGMRWDKSSITSINDPVGQVTNALIFVKEDYDEDLLAQVNAFIAKSKENGALDRLSAKWFADAEPEEHPDYTKLTGENGTLRIAVCDAHKPVSYQKGTMYTGYEVDFLTLFAEEYGYQLDLQGMSFDALIPTVASGKCDIGACGITITPERAESVTFSDPHMETYCVAVVRNESVESNSNKKMLADFENATIGIMTGTIYDTFAKERFPDAKYDYYSMMSDLIVAAEQGKIDGFLSETTYVTAAIWEGARIEPIEEVIDRSEAAYIFRKGDESAQLREQMNTFVRTARENGTLDALKEK